MTMHKLEAFVGNTQSTIGIYSTMEEAEQAAMDYTNSEECDFYTVLDITEIDLQDEYPSLSELVDGPVDILRDGQTIATVDSPNAAFVWLSKTGFYCSVSWMLKHEGYSCRKV